MTPERWQRLQALFEQALALPTDARMAFLDSNEADPSLRSQVLGLLAADAADDPVDQTLRQAAGRAVSPGPAADSRVGPWRLLEEIGSGGMATVFRACRDDGAYELTVAIKFLHGIASRDGADRMRRERQILASLDHPGIARLLDGGSTPQGQPYLVMELVDGTTITDHARQCDLDQRLRLLQQVARIVHVAHQGLVVHRDLKPANVLVRGDGSPVLLDFGIAKLLDAGIDAQSAPTHAWLTPGYASPEQCSGGPIGTASDIYSLGVLMAEVLTGEAPSGDALANTGIGRASALRDLPARRRRELDAIVRQACASHPRDRYPSAEALADDIERYFSHQPVRAAPARRSYVLATFLHRHRQAIAIVALLAIALIAFTVQLARERNRAVRAEALATENAQTTDQVVEYLAALFKAASPEQARNQPIAPGELIDRGLARVDSELTDQPRLQARLLSELAAIDYDLGRLESALASIQRAVALYRDLGDDRALANLLQTLGALHTSTNQPEAALAPLTEAATLFRRFPDAIDERVDTLSSLAMAMARLGEHAQAGPFVDEALAIAQRDHRPGSATMARSLTAAAEVASRSGRHADAVEAAQRAVAILRKSQPAALRDLQSAQGFLGASLLRSGRYAEAESLYRSILAERLDQHDLDSAWVIGARNRLAQAVLQQGRPLEALPLYRENTATLRTQGQASQTDFLVALNNLASAHERGGDYDESVRLFGELVERAQADPAYRRHLAGYRRNLGRSLMLAGDLAAARPYLETAVDPADDTDASGLAVTVPIRLLNLVEWHRRSGQFAQAAALLDQLEATLAAVPATDPRQAAAQRQRGLLAAALDRLPEAEQTLASALAIYTQAIGADSNQAVTTRVELAEVLLRRGEHGHAREQLALCREPAQRLFVADAAIHPTIRDLEQAAAR